MTDLSLAQRAAAIHDGGMEIRRATENDAEQAAAALRRSISERCHADHAADAAKRGAIR